MIATRFLSAVFAAVLALGAFEAVESRPRKRAVRPPPAVMYDEHGTPIIMQGYRAPGTARQERDAKRPAKRPPGRRRGSSTYIPPPVPSPSGGPPPPAMLQPPPASAVPSPPPPSFGDRVTRCLHSFPLNAGVGNNPTDRDAYVRACAN